MQQQVQTSRQPQPHWVSSVHSSASQPPQQSRSPVATSGDLASGSAARLQSTSTQLQLGPQITHQGLQQAHAKPAAPQAQATLLPGQLTCSLSPRARTSANSWR